MNAILVTGASGFLGKYLVPLLVENKVDFDALTRKPSSSESRYTEIKCDLAMEVPFLEDRGYHRVIHMAGLAHVTPKTKKEADRFILNNVKATENLLTSLSKKNNIPKHFTFISTVAVYGLDAGDMITEESKKEPCTPYGQSKLECEIMLQNWCAVNEVKLLILRPALIVGCAAKGSLLRMKNAIVKGRYVRIRNNKTLKSVVHAQPLCQLIVDGCALEGVYNVADDTNPTFAEIENVYSEALKKRIYISIPMWLLKAIVICFDGLKKCGLSVPVTSDVFEKIISDLTFDTCKLSSTKLWKPVAALELLKAEFK